MGQIPYTLKYKTGKPNKSGECLIYLRFYSNEHDLMIPTPVRILKAHFINGKPKNPVGRANANHATLNLNLDTLRIQIENRLSSHHGDITIDFLLGNAASSDLIIDFIDDLIKKRTGKLSSGTLRHYTVIRNKVFAFDPAVTFRKVNLDWLQRFEKNIREKVGSANTVNANMKKFKAILNSAVDLDLISKEQFDRYVNPAYVEDLPVYLEEQDIESFAKVARASAPGPAKTAAYYFLLACYAGYRISDLMSFNYEERVKDKSIVLRAKKNKSIVSIPIYPKLQEVLDFCKETPIGGCFVFHLLHILK